jgi:hypothetical protein
MPWFADAVRASGRWVRRRAVPTLGWLLLLAGVVYLIGGWLRADDVPDRTVMTVREGWVVLRPTWLYAALLLAVLVALLTVFGLDLARKQASRAAWREEVHAQVDTLRRELSLGSERPPRELTERQVNVVVRAVRHHLRTAWEAAVPHEPYRSWEEQTAGHEAPLRHRSPVERLVDAWSGAAIRRAFLNLHAAEVAMVALLSEDQIGSRIPEALVRLEKLHRTDQRRREAELILRHDRQGPKRRAAYAEALRLGYEIKDARHAQVRSFRNIVYATTIALCAVVLVLCVIGAAFPDAIPLCFSPSSATAEQGAPPGEFTTVCPTEEQPPDPNAGASRRLPAPGDVTLTALFGLLGGSLSGAFAIRKLQGTSNPYSVPVALSLLKLPSGALTAIVGILLVRGEFIPGLSQLDNQPQILAYAFVFGVAQQIATRYVDERAQQLLTTVPSKAAGDRAKGSIADPEDGPEQVPLSARAARAERRGRRPWPTRRT